MAASMASRDGSGGAPRNTAAVNSIPEVQNPHRKPPCSMKALQGMQARATPKAFDRDHVFASDITERRLA
jgi:hypothetical protein